ncbi:MAG TPA: hypothetical protein VM867_05345 [Xanthobacteraceae bacterium]|nr:hypothetical protein [Xanthobacteraceae bacterium]
MAKPALDFGFRPKTRSRGDEFVTLWRLARTNAEDGPACPCHGIVAGRIDPDTLEINMLSPLRTRYREAGLSDLRDVIERRLRKSPFAGMRQPFETWLHGLPTLNLTDQDRKILYDDIEAGLQHLAEAEPTFVCT